MYEPVRDHSGGAGRKPKPIADWIIRALQETYDRNTWADIELTEHDQKADLDAFAADLRRAGARHYPEYSVRIRRTPARFSFRLADKNPNLARPQ